MNKILCEINPIYPVKDVLPNGKDIYNKTTMELCKREILDAMMYGTIYAVENNERIRFTERDKVDSIVNQIVENRSKVNVENNDHVDTTIVKAFDTNLTEEPKEVVSVDIREEVLDNINEVPNTDEVVSVDIREEVLDNINEVPNTDEVVSVDIREEIKEEDSNSIPYKNIQKNNKNNKKK